MNCVSSLRNVSVLVEVDNLGSSIGGVSLGLRGGISFGFRSHPSSKSGFECGALSHSFEFVDDPQC